MFPHYFSFRQLSEENANLQVNVEKESNEKKRLSRTNEELLWRLQTGELSPHMSPSSSPIHRPPSVPGSPARPHSYHQWHSPWKLLYQTLSFIWHFITLNVILSDNGWILHNKGGLTHFRLFLGKCCSLCGIRKSSSPGILTPDWREI